MKIAVTGAHRTGKTTLAEELSRSLPGYHCEQEPYHQMEETGYTFFEIPTAEEFLAQLEHSIHQISENKENVIFDRCPVDLLAYIKATSDFGTVDFRSLYQRVENVMAEIDLLVLVPIEEPDLIGCSESEFPEIRRRVNDMLSDWVWALEPDVVEVSGPLWNRKNQVLKHVK